MKYILLSVLCIPSIIFSFFEFTPAQKKKLGLQIWQNEGSQKYENLVFWNKNEPFPSLGICHFIWYPSGNKDLITQTFPDLLDYFKANNITLPAWLEKARLDGGAPWHDKYEFDLHVDGPEIKELKKLLFETIDLQVDFIIARLKKSLPSICNTAPAQQQPFIEYHLNQLLQTEAGTYALIDYLNCKGEGTNPNERYNNQGWGLLQVLERMPQKYLDSHHTLIEFVAAAQQILEQRVHNALLFNKQHEQYWLPGWLNRIATYITYEKQD